MLSLQFLTKLTERQSLILHFNFWWIVLPAHGVGYFLGCFNLIYCRKFFKMHLNFSDDIWTLYKKSKSNKQEEMWIKYHLCSPAPLLSCITRKFIVQTFHPRFSKKVESLCCPVVLPPHGPPVSTSFQILRFFCSACRWQIWNFLPSYTTKISQKQN